MGRVRQLYSPGPSTSEESLNRNYQDKNELADRQAILLRSTLAGLAIAVVAALIWYVLDARVRAIIADSTESTARGVEELIEKDIETRVGALSALAHQLGESTTLTRNNWESLARIIYEAQPGYRSIVWIDPSLHVRWVVPLAGNETGQNYDLRLNPPALAAAKAALERNRIFFTTPIDSIFSGKGLAIYIPINGPTRDGGQFDGLVGSMLLLEPLLQAILPLDVMTEHIVTISIGGKNLFSTNPGQTVAGPQWVQQRQFELYNVSWHLDVAPTEEFLFGAYIKFSGAMLVLLILLSSLATFTFYFVSTSRGLAKQSMETAGRLDRLFSNLPGMSYRSHEHYPWAMVFVSEGCEAFCGYDREALETNRVLWGELIHPDDLGMVQKAVAEAVANQERFDIEYRIRTHDRVERWVWDRGLAIFLVEGQATMLDGFITDITARKRAEFSLAQEQNYSESIVAAAIEAVITVGAEGTVEKFNPAAERKFGYRRQEIEGKSFSLLLPSPFKEEYEAHFAEYQKSGEVAEQFQRREMMGKRKDGSEFSVQISIGLMQHQAERKLVCFVRDTSQRIAAERESRDLREKLAHVDRLNMLGEMATGIAHEINQPLTAISLFSQAGKRLLSSGKEDSLPDIFDKLSQHALRAGAIVERMQTMTEQHMSTLEILECNLLVEEVATLAEADARIRDIVIELDLAEGLPPVSVDRVQIQQVILNLLRNGMQSMQLINCERGDSIKLQTLLCDNHDIEIAVIDSGGGVSESAGEKVFKPFSTTREAGMGLGLSISRAIVLSHGGQIDYFNNVGGGATFYFTLPADDSGERHA